METVFEVVVAVTAGVLLCPALVFATQCIFGCWPWRDRPAPVLAKQPRVAVLVPAHNEAQGIGATIQNLLPQLSPGDRLVVIADNCDDDTAGRARAAAAESTAADRLRVLERSDPAHRGKGYALAFARASLAADPPDVVVFVDADCRVSKGSVAELAALAAATGSPIQADYLLSVGGTFSPLAVVGMLAFLVRNRVRPQGMARLALPCQLTGSGMAMPWALTQHADRLGANIVEDLVLGLELALAGHAPRVCPEVLVSSELPAGDRDAARQRRRWEHGQLAVMVAYAPKLFVRGVLRAKPALVALALDLAVPPLALLVLLIGATWCAAFASSWWTGRHVALWLSSAGLVAVVFGVLVAWFGRARHIVPFHRLLTAPFYIAWKLPLYLGLLGRRERTWQRTRRDSEAGS